MSNSPLVNYTRISPNKNSPRNHKIDTITIHCVVGQCSVETLGNIFAPTSRQASSNYGIGYDGKIGMYVEEKDRSWCSSSASNDNRAITIEVASDTKHPYAVNEKAFAALLDLVTDICKRNGIKRLVWSTNKKDRMNHLNGCNMTVHRDYANKACPGDYLYNRHGEIAAEVNHRLGATVEKPAENKPATGEVIHTVKAGETLSKIAQKYGTTYQKIAAYNGIANANLIHVGQKIKIPTDTQAAQSFKKGDKVKVLKAVTYTGKAFKTYYDKYDVIEADGDRVVIGIGKTVTAAVNAVNLKKAYNGIANANLIHVGQKIKIPTDTQAAQSFKKGDKVKVLKAVTYTGKAFKTYYDKYDVIEADGDRVVIGIGKTVTAAVNAVNLKKA